MKSDCCIETFSWYAKVLSGSLLRLWHAPRFEAERELWRQDWPNGIAEPEQVWLFDQGIDLIMRETEQPWSVSPFYNLPSYQVSLYANLHGIACDHI